ncbi:E3 ubiquitin-protein ligase TRIM38 [Galemys pyrenaicus]|uniref:E3 ubiquitin-protein ligase TRIM38 n=1 Tax=Galemys pyrenaicus TaxID=202257 RepID=A0A8J6DGW1_GALPY|nr:E3 ubiquitin-protein ligase TRIM38 [Galemys pyrenaicus]
MASVTSTKKMREEASCSICLELMTEPVSINCGHSFCRQCIEDILEKTNPVTSSQQIFLCPLCRTPFQRESLRPNKQLENLTETIRELERESLCEEHGEQLHLFCEDDGQLICWRCERSPQHQSHVTALVKDICSGYKEKLKKAVAKLRSLQEQCKSQKQLTREQITEWEENIELRRQKIQSDFKNLHNFLHEEEKCFLWRLEKEKEHILRRLQDGEASLKKQSLELKNHILELEEKCEESAHNLLQDVKDTLSRSLAVKLKTPKVLSLEPQTVCNVSELYLDVKKILRSYQVNVTLDPDTAHPKLILSEDQRQVTRGDAQRNLNTARRFRVLPCVLGCEGFIAGRYYFEVDVGEGTEWDLGVCLENVPRDVNMMVEPQSGFWAIRRCIFNYYVALTHLHTSLPLREQPRVVGVSLDYEAGLVSFYNMSTGSHIFTFPKASFSDTLRPFFRVYQGSPLFLPPPHKTMASATATKKMREEASCSICLELMTEPVSINCGHSFCRQCITDILEKTNPVTSSQQIFLCPLCRTPFQRESLRPNKQLENLTETIRELERESLCEEHGEQLHLFCEDDGQLICWRCERSPQHQGHVTALVKDICSGYKKQNWSSSGKVMVLASATKKLREETTCTICRQLMTEPVSINCEHSFCRRCIENNLQKQYYVTSWLGMFYCPQCKAPFTRASIRHNKYVETLLEYITTLCEEHGDPLHLFCEDDGHPICWSCKRSPQHRGHNTSPVEDMYPVYKEKVELQRQKIQCGFEKLHIFLREKEKYYLQELEEEKNKTLTRLQDNEANLAKQSHEIDSHILELEKKCQASSLKLLQGVKDTLSRSSAVKLEVPEDVSLELCTEFDFSKVCSGMKKMFLFPHPDFSAVKPRAYRGQKGVGLGSERKGSCAPKSKCRSYDCLKTKKTHRPPQKQNCSGRPSPIANRIQYRTFRRSNVFINSDQEDEGGSHVLHLPGADEETREHLLWAQLLQPVHNGIPWAECPIWCGIPFQKESLRPNRQLENLTVTIKEMEQEKLCEEHGQQLQVFCEDDGQLICWRCERSPQHRGHNTALVEDVCSDYKVKLQEIVTKLKGTQDRCKSTKLFTKEQITKWEENIELQRQKIQSEFRNLHNFLHEEEKAHLWRLDKEKEQLLRRLQDGEASLEKQSLELRRLLQELEKKCEGSAQNLLQVRGCELVAEKVDFIKSWTTERIMMRESSLPQIFKILLRGSGEAESFTLNTLADSSLPTDTYELSGRAMASISVIRKMKVEATCSICHQLMMKPISITCGHNFCCQCISEHSFRVLKEQSGFGPMIACPLCRKFFQMEDFRPNMQLQNLIETIKEMDRVRLCEEHGEQLHLFCEDDRQLICWRCERTPQHRGHNTAPVEDVCPGYKVSGCPHLSASIASSLHILLKFVCLKTQIENIELQRQKIQSEFRNLHNFLHEEEKAHLWRLDKEKEQLLRRLQDGKASLEKQSLELRRLLQELEKKCEGSAQDLLQLNGMSSVYSRHSEVKLDLPEPFCLQPQTVCNVSELYFDVKKMLKSFQVSVTLDPDTAHPELILSEDQRHVTQGGDPKKQTKSKRFSVLPCVLGCEGFTTGRHYFEVCVGEGSAWDIGVCLESVQRDKNTSPVPKSGFWAIRLCPTKGYMALSSPTTPLRLMEQPQVVGVFLDCDAGLVSFYDMNAGSHIFTFPRASFSDALRPYFQTGFTSSKLYSPQHPNVFSFSVSVTLNPDTAHPELILSKDRRQVTRGSPQKKTQDSRRFSVLPCVLGCEGFTSGRHYFEVDVGEGLQWDIGVCMGNVPKNTDVKLMPQTGFWAIRLCNRDHYEALTSPPTTLCLREKPKIMGLFLDCEAGLVHFYNVTAGSHIFTFGKFFLCDIIWPFFQVYHYSPLFLPPPEE